MRKTDTVLYKVKVCAISVLLGGLFAVFAAGCSEKTGSEAENAPNSQNGSTEPSSSSAAVTAADMTPSEEVSVFTRATLDGSGITLAENTLEKVTAGEISLAPITKPDISDIPGIGYEISKNEGTEITFEFANNTIDTRDLFIIGEDTTATMVYEIN